MSMSEAEKSTGLQGGPGPRGTLLGALGKSLLLLLAMTLTYTGLAQLSTMALAPDTATEPVETGLLMLAISALGVLGALRSTIKAQGSTIKARAPKAKEAQRTSNAAVEVALWPLFALTLLTFADLFSDPRPALLRLWSVALLGGLFARLWLYLLPESPPEKPTHSGVWGTLVPAGPLLAIGLLSAALLPPPLSTLVALAAYPLAAVYVVLLRRQAEQHRRETLAFAIHVRQIEVTPEALIRGTLPLERSPLWTELEREVQGRAKALARDARADARARKQVSDARTLRTRLMAATSHELRSPLNSILGFSQVLKSGMDGALTPGQAESVTMVHESSQELIHLLTDILDLAKLEANHLTLHRKIIGVDELLAQTCQRCQNLFDKRELELEVEVRPGLPQVVVDERRVVQALHALLRQTTSNLRGSRLRLRARMSSGPPGPKRQLRIEIYDVMGEMAERDAERIFEAFQEITEPAGRRVGGLGMALTLSRSLIRIHGGDVWVDTGLHSPTVICVALPIDD